jgi:thiamine-phosphate pyrophosphorylase
MRFPERGLYAITQVEAKSSATILSEVEAALMGGAKVVQYRNKPRLKYIDLGRCLLSLCHAYDAPLIINDDPHFALEINADGVHLGRDDLDIEQARWILGSHAIIGVSCYNAVDQALIMQAKGADYVAFGRFFPSGSKPLAAPADPSVLTQAKQLLNIPIVAIGGIVPENAGILLQAGADLLAVIGGLFDNDPETAARAFQKKFAEHSLQSYASRNGAG